MDSIILRKHILSNYAITDAITSAREPTLQTKSVELSDSDEPRLRSIEERAINGLMPNKTGRKDDPTYITHAIEISDPDEFRISDKSTETRAIETSDLDELYCATTYKTLAIVISDEDEFFI